MSMLEVPTLAMPDGSRHIIPARNAPPLCGANPDGGTQEAPARHRREQLCIRCRQRYARDILGAAGVPFGPAAPAPVAPAKRERGEWLRFEDMERLAAEKGFRLDRGRPGRGNGGASGFVLWRKGLYRTARSLKRVRELIERG